jgi:hypothetical protein
MKRVTALLMGLALLGGAAFWFNSWAWNTCQPLDRLFGQSGCTGSIEIADFSPLFRSTMAVTGEDGMASLLGWAIDEEGNRAVPTLLRLDPTTGRETARATLAMGEGFDHAVFSADREKILLTCTTWSECAGGDDAASLIVSAIDGTQIELVERSALFPRIFPGDPLPPQGFTPFALLAANGAVVVDQDDYRNVVMTELDSGKAVQLVAKEERLDPYAPHFVISPDQTLIAMSSRKYGQRTAGDRFWVWDAGDGTELMSMYGSPQYDISSNVVLSTDKNALFVVRKIAGGHMAIDRFAVP